ncbi:hypothetical protein [Rhodococcus daqingensis]|uniref:Serine hydrolase n=1 Tax=Rhodococcus daqingensis TaxID=2479363 RepID=A0ABW2S3D8_9NOCA
MQPTSHREAAISRRWSSRTPARCFGSGYVRGLIVGALTILICATLTSGGTVTRGDAVTVDRVRSEIDGSCGRLAASLAIAVEDAAAAGDVVGIAFVDREAGVYAGAGDTAARFPAASLAKLFIADDYLYRGAAAGAPVDDARMAWIVSLLATSDDGVAELLWTLGEGPAIIARVAARYELPATSAVGAWWDTEVTAADVARYYVGLLGGGGGLPEPARRLMIAGLQAAVPVAADGFDQDFGVRATLERLGRPGIKQGWMATGDRTIRHSTGFAGHDHRFVLVELADLDSGSPSIADDIANAAASDRATSIVEAALPADLTAHTACADAP